MQTPQKLNASAVRITENISALRAKVDFVKKMPQSTQDETNYFYESISFPTHEDCLKIVLLDLVGPLPDLNV